MDQLQTRIALAFAVFPSFIYSISPATQSCATAQGLGMILKAGNL